MKRILHLIVISILFNTVSSAQYSDSSSVSPSLKLRLSTPQFRLKSLFIPASLMLAGIGTSSNGREALKMELVEKRNELLPTFHTKIDNYLKFSPIVIAYGLDAAGLKSRTDFVNRTVILIKGELLAMGSVGLLKGATHQLRPDGSTYNSFPSGHTAQAFAAATFLSEEYKQRLPWIPYAAYGIAGTVGALRMANNRHYISDVLFGAGLGILSMKVAYWTHRYKWNKRGANSRLVHL
ncbi:MAG TPA: phosphatase PAP2 family protein [Flavitalea sp.]|nr:phosphatase PAP2 family protein [Flavitalea sp.]HTF28640.1 phosphatase PAP2 family protein [Flavitalea sp.]